MGAVGSLVNVTATVTPPPSVSDTNPANNSHSLGQSIREASTSPAGASDIASTYSGFANVHADVGSRSMLAFEPAGASTDRFYAVHAQDDPGSTTAQLVFRASLANEMADRTFEIVISERTPWGDVTRSFSGLNQNPSASLVWPNVAGRDDTLALLVRVRQVTGTSTPPVFLTFSLGGSMQP
jgi:hypothetical protein